MAARFCLGMYLDNLRKTNERHSGFLPTVFIKKITSIPYKDKGDFLLTKFYAEKNIYRHRTRSESVASCDQISHAYSNSRNISNQSQYRKVGDHERHQRLDIL